MEYKGTITDVLDEVQISSSFRKREFVVSDNHEKYPQDVCFQLTQDRCDAINPFVIGDSVTVSFNLRGRKWERDGETKYFNTLDAWKIEKA